MEKMSDKSNKIETLKGFTPLWASVEYGNLNCVKILLNNGANFHLKDSKGNSILHAAALNNQLYMLEYLCTNLEMDHFCLNDKG